MASSAAVDIRGYPLLPWAFPTEPTASGKVQAVLLLVSVGHHRT